MTLYLYARIIINTNKCSLLREAIKMSRIIFHIDVNSAYLSWMAARYLQLGGDVDFRDVVSVVGGDEESRHGIVLAKSIPAKKYDIQTGETLYSARQKYPGLIVIPPDYEIFMKASQAMNDLIYEYSPTIQRYSIDESFVDMTHSRDYMKDAEEISSRIYKELGFTVNIGIGENKLLAKMASDFEKPNKIHKLFKEDLPTKLWPLPVEELFFVGSRTKAKLNSRAIYTIGDLANVERSYIHNWLKKPGVKIWEFANGIESSEVSSSIDVMKSIGNSTTVPFDVDNMKEAEQIILGLCEMVGMRLRDVGFRTQVLAISIKDKEFVSVNRQRKLEAPTYNTNTIYYECVRLFKEIWKGTPLRQFSVRASDLVNNYSFQMTMFKALDERQERLDNAIDNIRNTYGHKSIHRACFIDTEIPPVIGGVVDEVEYPMMRSEL